MSHSLFSKKEFSFVENHGIGAFTTRAGATARRSLAGRIVVTAESKGFETNRTRYEIVTFRWAKISSIARENSLRLC